MRRPPTIRFCLHFVISLWYKALRSYRSNSPPFQIHQSTPPFESTAGAGVGVACSRALGEGVTLIAQRWLMRLLLHVHKWMCDVCGCLRSRCGSSGAAQAFPQWFGAPTTACGLRDLAALALSLVVARILSLTGSGSASRRPQAQQSSGTGLAHGNCNVGCADWSGGGLEELRERGAGEAAHCYLLWRSR